MSKIHKHIHNKKVVATKSTLKILPSATALPTHNIRYLEVGLAMSAGLFLWFLFLYPAIQVDVFKFFSDWPVIVIGNGENTSLTTYGKWFFNGSGDFLCDAFSGDVPVLYNYVSDFLNNALAHLTGIPPAMLSGLYLGPLQGLLFVLLNYFSLAKAFNSKRIGLLGSIFIGFIWHSYLTNLGFAEYRSLLPYLHVNIVAMGMGTNYVYLLFVPTLCMMHLAYTEQHWRYKVYFGLLLGLFVQVHTLTVINIVVINAVYLLLQNAIRLWKTFDVKRRQILLTLSALTVFAFFLAGVIAGSVPSLYLVALLVGTFILTFFIDPNKTFYLLSYPLTVLVASPYLLGLKDILFGEKSESFTPFAQSLPLGAVIVFYFPHFLAAILCFVLIRKANKQEPLMIWLAAMLIATLFLGFNHVWGWNNHPYRFIINLQIPLMIAAGYGIYQSFQQRNIAWAIAGGFLVLWFALTIVMNVNDILQGRRIYHNLKALNRQEYTFLKTIQKETKPNDRLLLLPEYSYPMGAEATGIILNYSNARSFIPDYRFLINREQHKNRMRAASFFFPEFPAADWQPGWKEPQRHFAGADGNIHLADSSLFVSIANPELKNGILAVYGVKHFAAMNTHVMQGLYPYLQKKAQDFHWKILASIQDSALFAAVPPVNVTGAATFECGKYNAEGFTVPCTTGKEGTHVLVLAGRDMLKRKVKSVLADGKPVQDTYIDNSVVYCKLPLGPGKHTLTLQTEHNDTHRITDDFVSFIALVHEQDTAACLSFAKDPSTLKR
jgi:hypothetical protein